MPSDFHKILIMGAGVMGRGIAQACAIAGCRVYLLDNFEPSLKGAEAEISRGLTFLLQNGFAYPQKNKIRPISYHLALEELSESFALIIEAITEDLEAKRNLFRTLEHTFSPDSILASNTSSFPISQIAAPLKQKGRVIGAHFIAPAQVTPLVEIVKGKWTSEKTLSRMKQFCKKINKKPIIVKGEITGFVLNRLQHALHREAYHLINLGITSPAEIDLAIKWALAPRFLSTALLEQKDITGIQVHYAVARELYPDLCNSRTPQGILPELIRKGRLGIKKGRGFYDWQKVNIPGHLKNRLQIHVNALKLLKSRAGRKIELERGKTR